MVDERLPGGTALAVATAEVGQRAALEGQAQSLAEPLKLLSLVQSLEKLLLGQGSIDLADGVSLHRISPWLR
jgi:hypothetical protein